MSIWGGNGDVKFHQIFSIAAGQHQRFFAAPQTPSLLQPLGYAEQVKHTIGNKCHIFHWDVHNMVPLVITHDAWYVTHCNCLSYLFIPHHNTHTFF